MSYILDALKKMEQEKNMKAAPKERINLSGALLKDDLRPAGRKKTGRWVGLILIVLIAASGIAWYLRGNTSKVAVTAAPQVAPQIAANPLPQQNQAIPSPAPQAVSAPVANVPPAKPASSAPLAVMPSSSSSVATTAPTAAAPVAVKPPVAPAQTSSEEDEEDARPVRVRRGKRVTFSPPVQAAQTSPSPSTAPASSTMAAPESIKVSGIAWQDERSARRAVVNDFLMKEGNVVAGAKIIEIKQDRVRFSLSGSTFDVPLISSATAPPK